MCRRCICLLLFWLSVAHAAPDLPDPSLSVSITVHGRFVNLMTGEQRLVTLQPQVLWAFPEELPTRPDLLRRAIRKEWSPAQLRFPEFWRKWQHRSVQTLNPPKGWLIWDAADEPLNLRVSVRDKEKRLSEIRLITPTEEHTAEAKNGVVQMDRRIQPTDACALILRGRKGTLLLLLARWTPLVYAERVGIVAEVSLSPSPKIDCDECRRGEALARQVRPDLPPPEKGFVRVYRYVREGEPYPTDVPHFPLKPIVDLDIGRSIVQPGGGGGFVDAQFVCSIPPVSEQEAAHIVWQEARKGIKRFSASSRGQTTMTEWHVYDVQRRRYVVIVWEARVRYDMLPSEFNSFNAAAYWTRDQANRIVTQLPLTPPNDVSALLVQRLRPDAAQHHIALKPRATLWFDANIVARRFWFSEPPSHSAAGVR